jgi:16S rRNA (guanine527-N7)-methyltransferase
LSDYNNHNMNLLHEGARRLGFDLTPQQIEQFELYYRTLLDWNARINLTSITKHEAMQVRHFLDSLTVGAALRDELGNNPPAGFSLIDIGTGAGFPGVALEILWPGIHLALADSIAKKTAFLNVLVEALQLKNVTVLTARAEELGQDKIHRQRYDAVTARAVASLPVLCEYCLPLAKVGGLILAPKKGDISHEIEDAKRATAILGGDDPRLHRFTLPGEVGERCVVTIRKTKPTPPGYPRRVGLAKSRPLGV